MSNDARIICLEWMVKVSEIFIQSKVSSPSEYNIQNQHFALLFNEKFNVRAEIMSLENSGFFDNEFIFVIEFSYPINETEDFLQSKVFFQFFPPKELPPQNRDERKLHTLPRRLSVAARIAYAISRLLMTSDISDMKYRITRTKNYVGIGSSGSRADVCSVSSNIGVLKVSVEYSNQVIGRQEIRSTPQVSMEVALKIEENYIQPSFLPLVNKNESFIRGESYNTRADSFKSSSPMSPYFSENSSNPSYSPISASRDLLTDIWPMMPNYRRKSTPALPPSSEGSAEYNIKDRSSDEDDQFGEKSIIRGGDGFFNEVMDDDGSSALARLLVFCRGKKLQSFKPIVNADSEIQKFLKIDQQLKIHT
jgi:hypothetical protein